MLPKSGGLKVTTAEETKEENTAHTSLNFWLACSEPLLRSGCHFKACQI